MKPGVVVLVHDETPCINWRLAVVEDTIAGDDGLITAANIRTSTGKTNYKALTFRSNCSRPFTELHAKE